MISTNPVSLCQFFKAFKTLSPVGSSNAELVMRTCSYLRSSGELLVLVEAGVMACISATSGPDVSTCRPSYPEDQPDEFTQSLLNDVIGYDQLTFPRRSEEMRVLDVSRTSFIMQ